MEIFNRDDLEKTQLPGRIIQKAIGRDAFSASTEMTMGFAHYSMESGPMEPHHHAEEVIYVLEARDAWVRFGDKIDHLENKKSLVAGDILHFPELEWHVFEYEDEGFLDIIFFYGRVDHIRPEEVAQE
jgi:uncharacterized RmlC-like cupin family protein